jgi:hypothetical protein
MPDAGSVGARVEPKRDRPGIPADYGIATGEEGLLPWSWAAERLERSRNYWIVTASPDGRPHTMPVWGVWVNDTLYFSTGGTTRKARDLAANPRLVVNLESGDEVVVLEGMAEVARDPAEIAPADAAYAVKYVDATTGEGFHLLQEDSSGSPVFVLRPAKVLAWREQDFPTSATRWRFGR